MSVLIVGLPGDIHAHAVSWAIKELGGTVQHLYPADLCDGAEWTYDPCDSSLSIRYRSTFTRIKIDEVRSVWMRRPPIVLAQEHLSDPIERSVAESDFSTMVRSICALLSRGRHVVNDFDCTLRAAHKPFQLGVAKAIGFLVPKTLVSNSPKDILAFLDECQNGIVFKPFKSAVWPSSHGPRIIPTTVVRHSDLVDSDLVSSPGIYQEQIDKRSEIRATVIGRSIFAWEKSFEGRTDLQVDWRFMRNGANHAAVSLPADVAARCFDLLRELGLNFGCFDFAVDAAGRYWFLEVNPQGAWLWGDKLGVGLNQLEGMAEYLLSGDPDHCYSSRGAVDFARCPEGLLQSNSLEDVENHYGHVMQSSYRQLSFRVSTALA